MGRAMCGPGVSSAVVREALTKLLADQTGRVATRDLVTAVYHATGDDRVGYGNVMPVLRAMAAEGAVVRVDRGYWQAVPR